MWTIVLLTVSNVFMTFAWYGHLTRKEFTTAALWKVVLVAWGIAFLEYCFQVPANRIGQEHYHLGPAKLKTIQEIITLTVFIGFTLLVWKKEIRWNHLVGFALMAGAAYFVFKDFQPR